MQTAVPCIASFCKADATIKAIDLANREKRTELFDCSKTLKTLAKERMEKHNLSCIELTDGRFVRLKRVPKTRNFTQAEVLDACKNIDANIFSLDVSSLVSETVGERLKQIQETGPVHTSVVITKTRERSVSTSALEAVEPETRCLIHEMIGAHTTLSDFRKQTNLQKRPYVEEKKRITPDVVEVLKRNEGMKQQVQLVDPKNGLKQKMILKNTNKETSPPLNLKTVKTLIKEAVDEVGKVASVVEFQDKFSKNVKQLLEFRPKITNTRVLLNKRDTMTKLN